MLPEIPLGYFPVIVLYYTFAGFEKYVDTTLGTFWRFQSPNGPTEGHVLRYPRRFGPKRGFQLHIIIKSLVINFWSYSGSNTVLEKDNVWFLIKFSSVWQQRQWLSLTQSQLIGFVWFLLLIKGNKRRCLWLKVNFYPTHPLKFLLFIDFWSQNRTHVCNWYPDL